jgi:hypothetical protein
MSKTILYLAWQDPQSRRWFTVGRLRKLETGPYEFVYIEGYNIARKLAGMEPIVGFMNTQMQYVSETLFPFFQNRIMSPNREDYPAYIHKLGFDEAPKEPLEILARSEGHRVTDSFQFQVFPAPTLEHIDDKTIWFFEFFIHGMRHVRPDVQNLELELGTTLYLMWDFQNLHDPNALTLRTSANHLLGWVPRFYCADILTLRERGQKINVSVVRMNKEPVPSWFRIMCRLEAHCPDDFHPFATDEFRPLAPHAKL